MNKRQLVTLGNKIQKGPKSIYARKGGVNEYLVDSFSIRFTSEDFKNYRTYQIFCDGNGGDETGYLPTIIRQASWDRSADMNNDSVTWPNIKINFFKFKDYTPALQDFVMEVQKKLDKSKVQHFGLPERRQFGSLKSNKGGIFDIDSVAGNQKISRYFHLSEYKEFENILDKFDKVIKDHGMPEPQKNWLEKYNFEWSVFTNPRSLYWDGKPQILTKEKL